VTLITNTDTGYRNFQMSITSNGALIVGSNWSNADNARLSDTASATAQISTGSNTAALYGVLLSMPAINTSAIIKGIEVKINRKKGSATCTITDNKVRLTRIVGAAPVLGTTGREVSNDYPTTLAYWTYGGASDLWGTTFTPSDFNNGLIGLAFSAICRASSGPLPLVYCEHMAMKVYYSLYGKMNSKSFSLISKINEIALSTISKINGVIK
jgi:hypothetical protein